jgi:hypothetical protein
MIRPRFTVNRAMLAVAIVAALIWAGRSGRRSHIETLNNPVTVTGWTFSGLNLSDGRVLPLPGIQALPSSSVGLAHAVQHGVEISEDGSVYGLVRVHHWCGNDPIRHHLARVNLSHLLAYTGEVTYVGPLDPDLRKFTTDTVGGRFSTYGFEVGEYFGLRLWTEKADQYREELKVAATAKRRRSGK